MKNEKFKTGDLVTLKSGGPTMTIRKFDINYDNYVCDWFDIHNEPKDKRFKEDQLEAVTIKND